MSRLRWSVPLLLLGTSLAAASGGPGRGAETRACPASRLTPTYTARVDRALRAGDDVWGNALIRSGSGPTYDGVRRYLKPLLIAGRAPRGQGRLLTDSGVYYVPFGQPSGALGTGAVALHVADGSQVIWRRVGGPTLTVGVGADGREGYGSCLTRLAEPLLYGGYLPILETRYVDAAGRRYEQESFTGRFPQTRLVMSFVRLTADAPGARARFATSAGRLFFSEGGRRDGSSIVYSLRSERPVYVAWLAAPRGPAVAVSLDRAAYETARSTLIDDWKRRLAEGATFVVPERRVLDAERNLLVQNLVMTWRYSVGNDYEEFSFPESIDAAQVLGEYGFEDVERAILRTSLSRKPVPYPDWKMGEKLLGTALHYRRFHDRSFVAEATPTLARYVAELGRQLARSRFGLLHRERYSSDIADSVYGLHAQAVVWQSLREIGDVWAEVGEPELARRAARLAARLGGGLRAAVRKGERRLADGSLFVPMRLLDDEAPYDALTGSRAGSYWNLVAPYAFASGFFPPGGPEARGILTYLLGHGSRLLGLVRAGAYALYGDAPYPTSGTDEVYGVNAARFLADNDQADQLALSLYGSLAAGMTRGTFVSGEGGTVAPFRGRYYRSMYLPPNSVSNAAFLETLRLMLVHETSDASGEPRGLQLAYATPRGWLRPGRRIVVDEAPTSFGPLSYTIETLPGSARVSLSAPSRRPPRALTLRLRLPRGNRLTGMTLDGRPFDRFDSVRETIDLSGRKGSLALVARYERR